MGCTEPWLWQNFCTAIGRADLAKFALRSEHFAGLADSTAQQAKQEVQEVLRRKTRDEWCAFFKDKNVCVGPVYTVAETFQDPQVMARHMVVDVEDRRYGTVRQAGVAIELSETPGSIAMLARWSVSTQKQCSRPWATPRQSARNYVRQGQWPRGLQVLHDIAIGRQVGSDNASVTALRVLLGTEQTGAQRFTQVRNRWSRRSSSWAISC